MFHLLLLPLFFILFIVILGLGVISTFLRTLFGRGTAHPNAEQGERKNPFQGTRNRWYGEQKEKRKKVFDKHEGEYIEFEEIKEEK